METRAEPRATPEAGGCETDVIGLTETFDAATDDEVEQGIVRLARDFPLADPGVWAYRPVSQSADCAIAAAWRAHLTAAPSFEMVEAAWGWCGHHDENAPRDVTESIAEALHARWHDTPSNRLWALIGQMVECRARLPSTLVRDILLKSGLGNFGLASARWALVRAAFAFGSGAGWILERKLSGAHMDECDVPGTTAAWIGSRQMAGDPIRQLDAKLWFRDGVVAESGDARTQKLARLVADLRSADRETSRRAFVSLARHHPRRQRIPRVLDVARATRGRTSLLPCSDASIKLRSFGPKCPRNAHVGPPLPRHVCRIDLRECSRPSARSVRLARGGRAITFDDLSPDGRGRAKALCFARHPLGCTELYRAGGRRGRADAGWDGAPREGMRGTAPVGPNDRRRHRERPTGRMGGARR